MIAKSLTYPGIIALVEKPPLQMHLCGEPHDLHCVKAGVAYYIETKGGIHERYRAEFGQTTGNPADADGPDGDGDSARRRR